MRMETFDVLPEADAVAELEGCCASPDWARAVAAGRPYGSVDALVERAGGALAALTEDEIDLALAGHPRIGERSTHTSSQREQSGIAGADAGTLDELAAGNRAYEERFGHVYLVFANGRPAAELLDILHTRLHNDAPTERALLRQELHKINATRLRRLLA